MFILLTMVIVLTPNHPNEQTYLVIDESMQIFTDALHHSHSDTHSHLHISLSLSLSLSGTLKGSLPPPGSPTARPRAPPTTTHHARTSTGPSRTRLAIPWPSIASVQPHATRRHPRGMHVLQAPITAKQAAMTDNVFRNRWRASMCVVMLGRAACDVWRS